MRDTLGPKIVLSAIAAILILGYAYSRMGNLMYGPRIVLAAPQNGAVTSSLIQIKGAAKNSTALTLNGRAIFINERGEFTEEVLLARGYNAIEVRAEDKFGRTATEKIEVVRR